MTDSLNAAFRKYSGEKKRRPLHAAADPGPAKLTPGRTGSSMSDTPYDEIGSLEDVMLWIPSTPQEAIDDMSAMGAFEHSVANERVYWDEQDVNGAILAAVTRDFNTVQEIYRDTVGDSDPGDRGPRLGQWLMQTQEIQNVIKTAQDAEVQYAPEARAIASEINEEHAAWVTEQAQTVRPEKVSVFTQWAGSWLPVNWYMLVATAISGGDMRVMAETRMEEVHALIVKNMVRYQ